MKRGKKGLWKAILNWAIAVLVVVGVWIFMLPAPHKKPHTKTSVTVEVKRLPDYLPPSPPIPPQTGGEESSTVTDVHPLPPVEQPPLSVPHGKKPMIAIVIDDVGLDLRGSKRATDLPAFITLSFIPYANHLKEQTRDAREKGHELLLHMPMEPVGHDSPGPGALLTSLSMPELQRRFETALASFTGFDGVNNHMGSKFTAYPAGMEMVVGELKQRNLFFLDSRTSPQTVGEATAKKEGLPNIARDVFLDDDEKIDAVRKQLARTEYVALHKGHAVAIGHPHINTLEALEEWIADAEARGFIFVPLHQLVAR